MTRVTHGVSYTDLWEESTHVHSGIGSTNHLPVVYIQTVLSTLCATHL